MMQGKNLPENEPDEWKQEIIAKERLSLICLPSLMASLLYPELEKAKDREKRLDDEGGTFMLKLRKAIKAKLETLE